MQDDQRSNPMFDEYVSHIVGIFFLLGRGDVFAKNFARPTGRFYGK